MLISYLATEVTLLPLGNSVRGILYDRLELDFLIIVVVSFRKIIVRENKRCCCPCGYHEVVWWSGGIQPLILNLETRWRYGVSFTPRPFYPRGKIRWYQVSRSFDGPQIRGRKKKSLSLSGNEVGTVAWCSSP
jgi:hypothetical protein